MKNRKKNQKKRSKTNGRKTFRNQNESDEGDLYEYEEKSKVDYTRFDQEQPDLGSSSNDELDEDEEIDEDAAFNSEDEEKYGDMFSEKGKKRKPAKQQNEEDDAAEENVPEEGGVLITDLLSKMDGPAPKKISKPATYEESESGDEENEGDHEGLLDFIGGLSSGNKKKKKDAADSSQKLKETELGYIRSGDSTGGKLTMDALMDPIAGTKGFSSVKKQMQKLKKGAQPLAPAAAAVVEDRVQREQTYRNSTKDMDKWQHFIKQNRDVETLDLSARTNLNLTNAALVGKFEPTTDMEKEIHALLEKSLGKDYAKEKDDDSEDDLGMNEITEEHMMSKQGELAKMRALMSYQAQKSNHMKKIKSKTYRRIRKRKRQKDLENQMQYLEEHDPEAARELAEEDARKRVAERMTLRHKNQGKWAKLALQRGKNMDSATKKAISEQNAMHQQLKKKIEAAGSENEENESDSNSDEENMLSSKDREALLKIGKGSTEQDLQEYKGKGKSIFKMKFMQRAMENQREQAKVEAQKLLEELEGGDQSDEAASEVENNKDEAEIDSLKSSVSAEEAKKSVSDALPKGSLQSKKLMMSTGTKTCVSGVISINLDNENTAEKNKKVTLSSNADAVSIENTEQTGSSGKNDENPWLQQSSSKRSISSNSRKAKKQKPRASLLTEFDSSQEKRYQEDTEMPESNKAKTPDGATKPVDQSKGDSTIGELSQEQLIQRAFAAPDLEADFKQQKEEINESSKKEVTPADRGLQGWGSWAGFGAPPPPKKARHDAPKKKSKTTEDLLSEKREDAKLPTVIINSKRIKKAAKYKTGAIPYPFTSREQYERAMRHPIGPEWNTTQTTKALTKPEILVRAGKVIAPGKLTKSTIKKHQAGELSKLGVRRPSKARL